MTAEVIENPAQPVTDDGTYGGYSQIARRLSTLNPERANPYSRQLVHRWYRCRDYNGFPESQLVKTRSGKVKAMFRMADVEAWHRSYRNTHRERIEGDPLGTIPLFQVTDQGITIW
jgi:hypothetical protein